MRAKTHCQETTKKPLIPLVEPRTKSKLIIANPKRSIVTVIRVDGCEITDNATLRCDYAVNPHNGIEIYIELKGSDIKHAIMQLESTISIMSSNAQSAPKLCVIVSTKVPRQDTSMQSAKRRFMQRYRAQLRVKKIRDQLDLSGLP